MQLYGCVHAKGAAYYRILGATASGNGIPTPGSAAFGPAVPLFASWKCGWAPGFQRHTVSPDPLGWYEILPDSQDWQPEHLLLDWVTGSMGVWELTLELGDAGKSVIYSAPPVTMTVDDSAPTATPFPTLFRWRYAGTSGWTNLLALPCPLITRDPPPRRDPDRRDGGGRPSPLGAAERRRLRGDPAELSGNPAVTQHWYEKPADNSWSTTAIYTVPADAPGLLLVLVRHDEPGLQPAGYDGGYAADWNYDNPWPLESNPSVSVAVVGHDHAKGGALVAQVETEQRHAAQAIHDALGVRLSSTAEGFDPLQAEDKELLVYGYPARPEQAASIRSCTRRGSAWCRVRSRSSSRSSRCGRTSSTARATHSRTTLRPTGPGRPRSPRRATRRPTSSGSGRCRTSSRRPRQLLLRELGRHRRRRLGHVLQAGTECDIVSFGFFAAKQTYVWWEWSPNFEVQIANFPVTSADVMFCAICVHSDTEAGFYLTNVTTGASTSFTKTAPSGTHLVGNCAEWIVEAPTVNGGQSALARYGDVYFDECIAGTKKNHSAVRRRRRPDHDGHPSNKKISIPTRETDELIKIQFTG